MRFRIIGLGVLAAALLAPASALARTTNVVPFRTVAGIPLKQSPAQVVKELGRPTHTFRVGGKIAEYEYEKLDVTVEFDTLHHPELSNFVGVTVGVFSRKIAYHTVHGIHMGSTKAAVRRAFGSRCHWNEGLCMMYEGRPGAVGTTSFGFDFVDGKVDEMVNQYVFDDL